MVGGETGKASAGPKAARFPEARKIGARAWYE
jgi:hypothetical protein